jgi:hypothetical protein
MTWRFRRQHANKKKARVLILTNEFGQTRRHRGSSPPFEGSEQSSHVTVMRLESTGQNEARQSALQVEMQFGFEQIDSTNLDEVSTWSSRWGPERRSFDGVESCQDQDDVSRWQDDGGESGEVV